MVPFKIDVYGGFGQCTGLLKDEGESLCLEFQTQDSLAGLVKSGINKVRIPLEEVVSVNLTKGWLGSTWLGVKVVIQTYDLETLKDVPGMSQGRIELSIASKDVENAEDFISRIYGQEATEG